MPRTSKSFQRNESPSPSISDMQVSLELDIKALRSKNQQLTQTVAKLQKDKAIQQNQITSLQEDFFLLNAKYAELKNVFSSIGSATKDCIPKHIELLNMIAQVINLCTLSNTVTGNVENKDTKTQAVKPHIVNGHVLHTPTITLSRLSDRPSATNVPSTSKTNAQRHNSSNTEDSEDDSDQSDDSNVNYRGITVVRRPNAEQPNCSINISENVEEEVSEEEEQGDAESEKDHLEEYNQRLLTIDEESEAFNSTILNANETFNRVREVRIILDPLPKDFVDPTKDHNSSAASPKEYVFRNRNSSLICETDYSAVDVSASLLNESTIIEDSFRASRSPNRKRANCFQNDSPQSLSARKYSGHEVASRFENEFSDSISIIPKVSNYGSSSKMALMKMLNLVPSPRSIKTSTPLQSPIQRTTSISSPAIDLDNTPMARVTKTRGGSNDKKNVKVVLQRLSGSPIKRIGDVLSVAPVRSRSRGNMRIKQERKDSQGNVTNQINNNNGNNTRTSEADFTPKKRRKISNSTSSPMKNSRSPRPIRAARPTKTLKEPSTRYKLRRSK